MQSKFFSASVVSVGAFVISQLLRFSANIILAKLLTPASFGLMAVVNSIMLGLALLSDLGLRLVVVQHKQEPSPIFLNTVWVLQILRGAGIWLAATVAGLVLLLLQATVLVSDNVYADPLLPYMVSVVALGVLLAGFESTNASMAVRTMAIYRTALVGLLVQILSLLSILGLAYGMRSPWALVWGGLVGTALQFAASYFCYGAFANKWQFDKKIALDILRKARWFLVSSPLTFLELNGAVMVLAALLTPTEQGQFMIAFSLVGVFRLVAQQLTGSVMFPAFSRCLRDTPDGIVRLVSKFQLATDGILVFAAGGFFIAGPAVVDLMFDHRYADAGQLVSILGIGLIGTRQCVIEQLITAKGWFNIAPLIILPRVLVLFFGCFLGYYWGGIHGAAWGISLSWFASWPYIYWKRIKIVSLSLWSEILGLLIFGCGYGLGHVFIYLLKYFWH